MATEAATAEPTPEALSGLAHPAPPDEAGNTAAQAPAQQRRSGRSRGRSSRRRAGGAAASTGAQDPAPAAPEPPESTESAKPQDTRSRPADSTSPAKTAPRRTPRRGERSEAPARDAGGRRPGRQAVPEEDAPRTTRARATTAATGQPERKERTTKGARGVREMLINVAGGDECRIAVLLGGRLEELFIERASAQSHVGNIYKGRVTNIEASIQAAFVDFGLPQNGFLHISDVQPQYFPDHKGGAEKVGRKTPRYQRPRIQDCFRRGQEVIVQVSREGVGTKGPTLTTYLSIAGRYLVMMPGMNRHGVSRKIEGESERRSMRDLLKQLNLPPGMGFILRTAGFGRTNRELQRDLNYLMRLWKTVVERTKARRAPAELYQESDLVTRTIRDVYTTDFKGIIVDDAAAAQHAREFLQLVMPRTKSTVELYDEREPLFHRYGIEEEIERINMRYVPLPSGGSLVIDSTEALVAIDVNSGRSRVAEDADEAAFQINLEAAEEIARQLRLRDLGGLIICDFIDMKSDRRKRAVEQALREALKIHKERARISRISAFGLLEITRQRQGPSLKRNIYADCPHCKGSGLVKMPDSVILDVMRIIQLATSHEKVHKVTVTVATNVAFQILNTKRAVLNQVETETGKRVVVRGAASFTSDQVDYVCEDRRGQPVNAVSTHASTARL